MIGERPFGVLEDPRSNSSNNNLPSIYSDNKNNCISRSYSLFVPHTCIKHYVPDTVLGDKHNRKSIYTLSRLQCVCACLSRYTFARTCVHVCACTSGQVPWPRLQRWEKNRVLPSLWNLVVYLGEDGWTVLPGRGSFMCKDPGAAPEGGMGTEVLQIPIFILEEMRSY